MKLIKSRIAFIGVVAIALMASVAFRQYASAPPSPDDQKMEDEVRTLAKQIGVEITDLHCSIGKYATAAVSCHVARYDMGSVESNLLETGWTAVKSPPNSGPDEHGDFKKNHKYLILEASAALFGRSAITVGGFVRHGDA